MARPRLPEHVAACVLVLSRRRCCLCYGLERDTGMKIGQIAHLDQDPANNDPDNLVFLCFAHHDQYDTRTSQSKGLLRSEVVAHRDELYAALSGAFGRGSPFARARAVPTDVSGTYIRLAPDEGAEIVTTRVRPDTYRVTGLALWGRVGHTGEIDFTANVGDGLLVYGERGPSGDTHAFAMHFFGDDAVVQESGWLGAYGMKVNFCGRYGRVSG